MSEQIENTRFYRLLDDKPADEDGFGGEGHQRSAKALATAIEKLTDEDGAIGIEGGWGAGKSTVVRFAEKLLKGSTGASDYRVFTFDLWAHGMHDIRRPLLEELVAWSDREGLLGNKQKRKQYFQDKIRDRNEVVTRTFSRQYNFAGIVALVLAPFIPLALTWLSPFAFRGWVPESSNEVDATSITMPEYLPWVWGGAITVFVLLYLNFLVQALRKGMSNAVSLYESKSNVETEDRNIRRRDPATTEFHRIFRELLAEIQSGDRRLVLVLDNIDRITEGRLADAWAETRSVFAAHEPGADPPKNAKAVTCIVPYDLNYVADNLTAPEDGTASTRSSSKAAAEALIRKTFKAVIRVSPPISADWAQYFYDRLDDAIQPGLDHPVKYRLFKIFEIERRDFGHPTPRDIISYVNEIVLHAEQWQEEIPLEAIALYLACRTKLAEEPDEIIADDLASEYAVGVSGLDSEWRKYVAALFYNVHPSHSERVMLEHRLADALTGKSEPDFTTMSKLPNFASALSDVVKKEARAWATDSVEVFDRAAARMGNLSLADYESAEIWREFTRALSDLNGGYAKSFKAYEGLRLIVLKQPKQQQVIDAGVSLIEKFELAVERDGSLESWEGANWFEGVEFVLDGIESEHGREIALKLAGRVVFPSDAGAAVEACEQAGSSLRPKWPLAVFSKAPKSTEHAAKFKEWFNSEPGYLCNVLRARPPFLKQAVLVDAAHAMIGRLRDEKLDDKNSRSEVVGALTEAVVQLPHLKLISQQATEFIDQGFAIWHAGAAIEASDNETAGKLIWLVASYRLGDLNLPSPPDVPTLGPMETRAQAYNEAVSEIDRASKIAPSIAELVNRRSQFQRWQSYALADPSNSLKAAVYETLIDSGLYNGFNDYATVAEFDKIQQQLAGSLVERLVNWMGTYATDPHEKFEGEAVLEISPSFIREVARYEVSGLRKYGEAIDTYLLQLSTGDWREAIEEDSRIIDRLCLRIETAKFSPKAIPFREAVVSHLIDIVRGEKINSPSASTWDKMLEAFKKPSFKALLSDFCSSLKGTVVTGEGAAQVAGIVPRLIESALEGPGSGVIVSKIITPLLHADLKAAATLVTGANITRESVSEFDREMLVGAVADMLRGELGDEDQERLEQLCAGIGVPMPIQETTEASPETGSETDK